MVETLYKSLTESVLLFGVPRVSIILFMVLGIFALYTPIVSILSCLFLYFFLRIGMSVDKDILHVLLGVDIWLKERRYVPN